MYQVIAGAGCLLIGLLIGWLISRKQSVRAVSPPAPIDYEKLYREIKEDILDDIDRDKTIDKIKERLGK